MDNSPKYRKRSAETIGPFGMMVHDYAKSLESRRKVARHRNNVERQANNIPRLMRLQAAIRRLQYKEKP